MPALSLIPLCLFHQLAAPLGGPAALAAAGASTQCEPPVFSDAERAERARILAALDVNGGRRQDTANTLGISRKVLWEKMRKLHLGGGQGETADGIVEALSLIHICVLSIVVTLLQPLLGMLSTLLQQLLDLLGLSVGQTDVSLLSVDCGKPRLVY